LAFLLELFAFLVAAILVVPVCKRFGLSSVIGYLIAGLLIGPEGLGLIEDSTEVLHFAEIGVVLLLFVIGLELQPRRLWVMRQVVVVLGSSQVFASTTVISLLLYFVLGLSPAESMLLGFALSLSSTAFVLQLLGEQKKLNHSHGRASFGVLLLQDVAVIPVIAFVAAYGSADQGGGFDIMKTAAVIGGLVAARFLLRPALRVVASTGIHELFVAASLAIVTGSALAMQYAGLSMGLGAFIAGMLVADSEYRHQLETDVMPFKGLLLGLFFMAVGMSANLGLIVSEPGVIVGLAIALVLVKALVLFPVARLNNLSNADAIRTALLLSQGGEFAFVLLTVASGGSLIDQGLAEKVVMIVTLSMVSTPLLTSLAERVLAEKDDDRPFDDIEPHSNQVIIAGFGRFAQIVARVLSMQDIGFTALDKNPGQVDFVRQFGNEVYYGDLTRLDLLKSAGVADAKALVIAMNDEEASIKLATLTREAFPHVTILARARSRYHELKLREIGVQHVVRETLHSSLSLTEELLLELGFDSTHSQKMIDMFRQHDRKTLESQRAVFHDEDAYRQSTQEAARELRELFRIDSEKGEEGN
jgi:glutathione-regulated potassium-efflux system ancillary protein KefC/glutathione-regulated potassium-efflux system protein KefB